MTPRVLPFGEAAVLVELGDQVSTANARRAQRLARAVAALREPGLGRPVPGAASILVPFDPLALDAEGAAELLGPLLAEAGWPDAPAMARPEDRDASAPVTEHRILVRYGGADGPDLESVADELGRSPGEIVALHGSRAWEVLFLGFAPGFAYLGELPPELVVPRLATPRVRVPPGSVAIAGAMTAVYPSASAGGWRLLGRTDARLFDPAADPPALLRPGDRVRFVPA